MAYRLMLYMVPGCENAIFKKMVKAPCAPEYRQVPASPQEEWRLNREKREQALARRHARQEQLLSEHSKTQGQHPEPA